MTKFLGNRAFRITETVFLKLLGVVYLCAFGSLWPQIAGLVGANGVSPAAETMAAIHAEYGWRAYLDVPSLFWLAPADWLLKALCAAGCGAALLLLCGVAVRMAALAAYVFYLSLVSVGQPFTSFQWDALLLEAGFLAIFAGASLLPLAYRFLLFRLMFESGLVKLTSGDENWRNLHALRYHFFTQPLPTPLAYYVQHWPFWLLDSLTLATLIVELCVPFLLFVFSARVRKAAAVVLVGLQVFIALTGNYAFFNLLTAALCVWALDDEFFARIKDWRGVWPVRPAGWLNAPVAGIMALGLLQIFGLQPAVVDSFSVVNGYGLFAVMTTSRTELVIEGSNDRTNWREYSLPFKPGQIDRALPVLAPLQPRLDWQFWFAALGSPHNNSWTKNLAFRLLLGETEVLNLLCPSPFKNPPSAVRIRAYNYTFAPPEKRRISGSVWQRTLRGDWLGPVSLGTTEP